jgi:hypothetical protein
MRTLIGLVILGTLFLLAAFWQEFETSDARDRRRHEFGVEHKSEARLPGGEGWTRLVLGSPSRALSRRPDPDGRDSRPTGSEPGGFDGPPLDPGVSPPPEPASVDNDITVYEVKSGEFLGGICSKHYGTSRPRLVNAVAKFNGLSSPDALRADTNIQLPPLALLAPE